MRKDRYQIIKSMHEALRGPVPLEDILLFTKHVVIVGEETDISAWANGISSYPTRIRSDYVRERVGPDAKDEFLPPPGWKEGEPLPGERRYSKHIKEMSPLRIRQALQDADLVITSGDIGANISRQVQEANLGVDTNGTIFREGLPVVDINRETRSVKQLDEKTLRHIFCANYDRPFKVEEDDESFHSSIDRVFFDEVMHKLRFSRDGGLVRRTVYNQKYPDRSFVNLFGASAYQPAHTHQVFRNGYGYGKRGVGVSDSDKLWGIEKWMMQKLMREYEGLWTKPLATPEEANHRLKLYEGLITDTPFREGIDRLVKAIFNIINPFYTVAGMTELATANLLHSKWGARLHGKDRDAFYSDFMYCAHGLLEQSQLLETTIRSINATPETALYLAPMQAIIEGDKVSGFQRMRHFLENVLDAKPGDFRSLYSFLEKELERSGAKPVPELEKYTYEDELNIPASNFRTNDSGTVSIKGFKGHRLAALQERLQDQNQVSSAKASIEYLIYSSIKLQAFAAKAKYMAEHGWTRPEILNDDSGTIRITRGYYPLTRLQHGTRYVRNDTTLDQDNRIEIIDGPNISGKTIDMRKTAFAVACIMTGSYVPADSAQISWFDLLRYRIKNTGIGVNGALQAELKEFDDAMAPLMKRREEGAAQKRRIIMPGDYEDDDLDDIDTRYAPRYNMESVQSNPYNFRMAFVGYDEFGTSTNDVEGEAIVYAVVRRLSEMPNVRGVLSSHFPSLQQILNDPCVSGVKFSHFEFSRDGKKLIFPHKKIEGPNKIGDYAIDIAEFEGVPASIIAYARGYNGR